MVGVGVGEEGGGGDRSRGGLGKSLIFCEQRFEKAKCILLSSS